MVGSFSDPFLVPIWLFAACRALSSGCGEGLFGSGESDKIEEGLGGRGPGRDVQLGLEVPLEGDWCHIF